jgi:hypothetical protein
VHQGDVSFYIKNVDLISLKQKYNYENIREKTIETEGHKCLLNMLKLVGISRCDEFRTKDAYINLALTNVKSV